MRAWHCCWLACAACGIEPSEATLATDVTIVGKCVFDTPNPSIEPGDIYVYAATDDAGLFHVMTGTAAVVDVLDDDVPRQRFDELLPARWMTDPRWPQEAYVEFGGLASDRSGQARHYIGVYYRDYEIYTAIGTTYGTNAAYPACAFR
jgi:hypothetical protein